MVELVDTRGLSPRDSNIVRVQIPLGALTAYARFLCGKIP